MRFRRLLTTIVVVAAASTASTAALALTAGQQLALSATSRAAPDALPDAARPSAQSDMPQSRFRAALEAWEHQDYPAAAQSIREVESWIRLETAQAVGEGRQALDASSAELDSLATALERGKHETREAIERRFAKAEHALALSHRANAASAWAKDSLHLASSELRAAGKGLAAAANWAGSGVNAAVVKADTMSEALANKIAAGENRTRREVASAFEALGHALDALGNAIGAKTKALPFEHRRGAEN